MLRFASLAALLCLSAPASAGPREHLCSQKAASCYQACNTATGTRATRQTCRNDCRAQKQQCRSGRR